jgi:streptogramin lyase
LSGFLGNNLECKSIAYLAGNLFAAYSNPSDLAKDSLIYFDGNSWKMTPHFGNGSSINSINVSGSKLYCSTGWGEFTVDEKLNFNVLLSSEYTPYPTYATSDKEGNTWISDKVKTLIKITPKGISSEIKPPDSPFYPDVVRIDIFDGRVWTAAGSKNELWGGMYNHNDAQGYFNGSWHWYNAESTKELLNVRDIINVKICPSNTDKVYLASWTNGGGLIEINNGEFKFYNNENSSLQFSTIFGACQINGLSFDNSGNLWVTNSNIKKQLSVLTQKGVWKNFSLGNTAIANGNIGDVLVTSWGHKWVVLGKSTNLVVFDSGNDPLSESDDRKVDISLSNVQSIIQPLNIYCIAEDHQGSIWIGTDAGPVRFDSPQNAFDDGGTSGAKIKVPIANGKTDAAYLLETERINAIAIDGADRKWFGTQNSGVYLMSDDGLKQISHFTSENSPLFSNSINDIKIDPKSGEVYFATDKGLISYRGYAKQGGDEFGKVYVYPNPIRENYTSDIFITGLIENTIVKITDISGNLVFETKSLGGQAVWDGKNLLGKRVNTGVYLVFCSNKDGSKTAVAKLLFIH